MLNLGGEAGIRTLGNLTATRALQARALGQAMRPLLEYYMSISLSEENT